MVYKGLPRAKKRGEGEQRNLTYPPLGPSQSMKLTKEKGPPNLETLTYSHKHDKNRNFKDWTENTALSKATMFLSLQIVHKMQGGAIFQAFLGLLTGDGVCTLGESPWLSSGKIQATPNKEKHTCHRRACLQAATIFPPRIWY